MAAAMRWFNSITRPGGGEFTGTPDVLARHLRRIGCVALSAGAGAPNALKKRDPTALPVSAFQVSRVPAPLPVAPPSARAAPAPKLLFLVTEDWFFWSHRLPLARAARDAGFAVIVATRVRDHAERIRGEGFALRPLAWQRRGDGLVGAVRAIVEIARLYRAERPDIVNHVALKAIVFGAV